MTNKTPYLNLLDKTAHGSNKLINVCGGKAQDDDCFQSYSHLKFSAQMFLFVKDDENIKNIIKKTTLNVKLRFQIIEQHRYYLLSPQATSVEDVVSICASCCTKAIRGRPQYRSSERSTPRWRRPASQTGHDLVSSMLIKFDRNKTSYSFTSWQISCHITTFI